MKTLAGIALAALSPALLADDIAGNWVGVGPEGRHLVFHITGPDGALKATNDSPEQSVFGVPVPSITFSGSTLQLSIPLIDLRFEGDLLANGTIAGTLTQHGRGVPFTLERTSAAVGPPRLRGQPAGTLENGRYHHNATGVEFDVPAGWYIGPTRPQEGDPSRLTMLVDPSHHVVFAPVYMVKFETPPGRIAAALDGAVPFLLGRRAGETGEPAVHRAPNYAIRAGSEQRLLIGGQQALQAIGEYRENGKLIAELLTWIYTEHTHAFFVARVADEDLSAVQTPFQQMVRSARVP
jgi:hypothetical protein